MEDLVSSQIAIVAMPLGTPQIKWSATVFLVREHTHTKE